MIEIKMHEGKWRISIREENWEFDDTKKMLTILEQVTKLKESYGKLKMKGGTICQ